jgi:hypothetical protein
MEDDGNEEGTAGWRLLQKIARELEERDRAVARERDSAGAAPAATGAAAAAAATVTVFDSALEMGLHTSRLVRKRMRENDALSIVPYPPRTIGSVRDNLHLQQHRHLHPEQPTPAPPPPKRSGKDGKPKSPPPSKSTPDDIKAERNSAKRLVVVNGRVVHGLCTSRVDPRWKDIMMAKSKAKEVPEPAVFPSQPPVDAERRRPPTGALVHDLMIPASKDAAESLETDPQQTGSVTVPSISLTVGGSPPTGQPTTPSDSSANVITANGVAAKPAPDATREVVRTMGPLVTATMLAMEKTRTTPPKPFVRTASQRGLQTEGTDVDQSWDTETQELQRFLSALKRRVHRRSSTPSSSSAKSSPPAAGSIAREAAKPERPLDRQAQQFLAVLEQDVAAVRNAASLAELNVQTYLEELGGPSPRVSHSRAKSQSSLLPQSNEEGSSQSAEYQKLLSDEQLSYELRHNTGPNLKNEGSGEAAGSPDVSGDEYKRLLTSAARDAAIFRETARIIRRKARELCERRIASAP